LIHCVQHDTTTACRQGKGESLETSRKNLPWVPTIGEDLMNKINLKTNLFQIASSL
jgi:hypothetical protein